MCLAETIQLGESRIRPAFLGKIRNRRKRHLDVGVDQFLAALYVRQVQSRFRNYAQATDVRHQTCRIQPGAHQVQGFLHVIGVPAAGADHMSGGIVHVVEIERSLEISFARARAEP